HQARWHLCSALLLALYAYWAMLHCALSFEVRYIISMQSVATVYGLKWLMCAAEAAIARPAVQGRKSFARMYRRKEEGYVAGTKRDVPMSVSRNLPWLDKNQS